MVEIQLTPRPQEDGTVVLGLGVGFRIVFGVLAALLVVGIAGTGTIGWIPAGVLVVMVVGALYQEQWILDPNTRTVTARHGLIPLARTRHWSFEDIAEVRYLHYRAGSVPGSGPPTPPGAEDRDTPEFSSTLGRVTRGVRRRFLQYSLVTHEGKQIRIEMRKVTDWNTDFQLPQMVAETLAVPLHEAR